MGGGREREADVVIASCWVFVERIENNNAANSGPFFVQGRSVHMEIPMV